MEFSGASARRGFAARAQCGRRHSIYVKPSLCLVLAVVLPITTEVSAQEILTLPAVGVVQSKKKVASNKKTKTTASQRSQTKPVAATSPPGTQEFTSPTNPPIQAESAWGPVKGFVAQQSATASKTATPLIETPQAVSVVTADQIRQQDAQSVAEALLYTSGVDSDSRAAFSGYDIIFSRGFILDRYLDGMKVLGGAGYTAPQIEPFGLERLEVLHGPASMLYGASSPGGLVNAVSKRPTAEPYHELGFQTGNFNRLQGTFDFSGPVNDEKTLLYRVSGLARNVDSQVDFTEETRYFLAPALTWRPNIGTSLTILATLMRDPNVGLYNFVPATGTFLPNPNGKLPRSRYLGNPDFNVNSRDQNAIGYLLEHRFGDAWTFRQNLRYQSTDGTMKQLLPIPFLPVENNRTLERFSNYDRDFIDAFTLDNNAEAKFLTGPIAHKFLLGFDYQWLSETELNGQDFAPAIDIFDPFYGDTITAPPISYNVQQAQNQMGVYVQDQAKFNRLVVTSGVRQDWVDTNTDDRLARDTTSQNEQALTWREGVNYVFDSGFAPYASYSTSFQPTIGTSVDGTPFEPTTGQQYEAGIKYQPRGINALLTAAVFDLTQQNVLTIDPTNTVFLIQTGEIRSRGFELEGKASIFKGFDIIASYTNLNAEVTKSNDIDLGKRPLNVPEEMATLWGFYTFARGYLSGIGIGGGVRYVGDTAGNLDNSLIVPRYTLADAALQYDFGKRWPGVPGLKFNINVRNVFDHRYVSECSTEVNCVYGNGRTILTGLRYSW